MLTLLFKGIGVGCSAVEDFESELVKCSSRVGEIYFSVETFYNQPAQGLSTCKIHFGFIKSIESGLFCLVKLSIHLGSFVSSLPEEENEIDKAIGYIKRRIGDLAASNEIRLSPGLLLDLKESK